MHTIKSDGRSLVTWSYGDLSSGDEEIKLSSVRHANTIRPRRRATMKLIPVLAALSFARAMPAAREEGLVASFVSALTDCVEGDTMLCLKEKAMKYTENLAVSKELNVADGITFSRTGSPRSARSYQPLSDDPKAREVQIEERILDNVIDFLDNHVVQLRMPKSFVEDNVLDEEGE
ncbi:hypothetical protein EVAR_12295_1 [Eumeta japonica]|uniref:Uncharacterized protein n=1 Tax=Eumeta variegata TaxID=151549 RepID=A0A4C1TU87_EUMVA|nr:hypothetical protein EVAR_12295_1 [Eumeta japonica]